MQPNKSTSTEASGTLFIVATPIGNLRDFSPRAIAELQNVQLILAEDTRKFAALAREFAIHVPVHSYHEHNERKMVPGILSRLNGGENVALISEAGTPCISDPGYRLVRAARAARLKVQAVPGPCAAIAALSISGLPTNRFLFEGFLSHKPAKRQQILKLALASSITTIFFESPHRILKTLSAIEQLASQREVFLAKELTKLFEEAFWGTAAEIKAILETRGTIKGEFTLIISSLDRENSTL